MAADGGQGTVYDINLGNEPSGVSGYFNLHLDPQAEQQTFGMGLTLARDAIAEVRVRQYLKAGTEEYSEIVGWTRVDNRGRSWWCRSMGRPYQQAPPGSRW